jgi:hypothetical protein
MARFFPEGLLIIGNLPGGGVWKQKKGGCMKSLRHILVNMSLTPGKYNSEPVYYCTNCLSLNVKAMGENSYCDDCGSTEME